MKLQIKKHENLDSKLQILTPNREILTKTPGNFHFFIILLSCLFIFLARGTWNPGKPCKSMKNNGNHQKQTKENEQKMKLQMKKPENLDSKLQILTPNLEIFKNSGKFSFFYDCFIMFFWFSLPVAPEIQENHVNQWITMGRHQKQTKENERKWSCKWIKMKTWTQSCRFSLRTKGKWKNKKLKMKKTMNIWTQSCRFSFRTGKSWQNSRTCSFFNHGFIIFFIFLARGTWNPGKPWKSMKNNGKPSKTKKNGISWKKKVNFGLKVADSHSEPGNLDKNSRKCSCLSCFFHFPCPWHLKSRKTMKMNEKQWTTIKNKGKWKKKVANEKTWENLDSKLQILTPNHEIFKSSRIVFVFLWLFYHVFLIFLARGTWNPGKPRTSMKNYVTPSKTNKGKWKKHEVANEKNWKPGLKVAILTPNQEIFKNSQNFSCLNHVLIIFFARGTWNPG